MKIDIPTDWELEAECGDCGSDLEPVRPGKFQCPNPKCASNRSEQS